MLEGQIIVTGASRGIGEAISVELAKRGYDIVGLSRSGTVSVGRGIACDLTDERSIAEVIGAIGRSGAIIGLVNNAGAHFGTPSAELTLADFEASVRLNASSVLMASREAYPFLRAYGDGLIVNIGSIFGKLGVPQSLAYCAAKAAVGAMTRCLAVEWARDGIRVIDVAPGYIETALNQEFLQSEPGQRLMKRRVPLGRPGRIDEVARLVASLFSENIAYLTGETIYLDGGHGAFL